LGQYTHRVAITNQRIIKIDDQSVTGFDVYLCPFCKQGMMHPVEELPRVRSPSGFYALTTDFRS
jgi:hypothetical protein